MVKGGIRMIEPEGLNKYRGRSYDNMVGGGGADGTVKAVQLYAVYRIAGRGVSNDLSPSRRV